MSNIKDINKIAAKYWSSVSKAKQPLKNRWWQHKTIIEHINQRVCGESLTGPFSGFHFQLKKLAPQNGFKNAISIGCGNGIKEIGLVTQGIVNHFELFELSEVRIEEGIKLAKEQGVSDKIKFYCADGLESVTPNIYDLVYWNNSLHHMLDVDQAIKMSKLMLMKGGVFAMDDFIGPSRFQWTDTNLDYAKKVRELLDDRFFIKPDTDKKISSQVERPLIEDMIRIDPTEAADSSNILPALDIHFPDAETMLTGGCIYHSGLNDVLGNFTNEDENLLKSLLLLDDVLTDQGESHYCVSFARKSQNMKSNVSRKDKVQVGCGPHNLLDDWWNVDIRDFKGIDQVMDVAKPWPWKNCIKYIYGEHFIEHLSLEQAVNFITHAGDALVEGGKIRLSTPSLEWVLKTHYSFDTDNLNHSLKETFRVNRAFHGWGHQFLYSKEMLQAILEGAGFREITWCEYGKSDDDVLINLEQHGAPSFAHGYPSVWVVEASKISNKMKRDEAFFDLAELDFLRYVRGGH